MIFFDPSPTWNRNNFGFDATTGRFIIPSYLLQGDVTTVRLLPGYRGAPYVIDKCYIGQQAPSGDPYDFDGNQVQLFWSGSPGKTINAANLWSDYSAIAIDSSKNLVLSFFFGNPDDLCNCETCTGFDGYYKVGDDAATTDATGYAQVGWFGTLNVIEKLEGTYVPPNTLSGTIKVKGVGVERIVRSYIRSTGVLFDSSQSNPDGSFAVGAPNTTTDMFVIAFDDAPGDLYNDLIYARLKGI